MTIKQYGMLYYPSLTWVGQCVCWGLYGLRRIGRGRLRHVNINDHLVADRGGWRPLLVCCVVARGGAVVPT